MCSIDYKASQKATGRLKVWTSGHRKQGWFCSKTWTWILMGKNKKKFEHRPRSCHSPISAPKWFMVNVHPWPILELYCDAESGKRFCARTKCSTMWTRDQNELVGEKRAMQGVPRIFMGQKNKSLRVHDQLMRQSHNDKIAPGTRIYLFYSGLFLNSVGKTYRPRNDQGKQVNYEGWKKGVHHGRH